MLGSIAVYRQGQSLDNGVVEAEVVRAPGLAPGTRLRFTAATVRRMTSKKGK
jgi:hypothetical protein